MRPPAKSDRTLSIASKEFVWSGSGYSDSHRYLLAPTLELLNRFGPRSILDLGCGNGIVTGLLAATGYRVQGCDASGSGIQVAQASFPGIPFFQFDLAAPLPKDQVGRYDAVVSLEVIEHLLLPRMLMANALQALRPGGLFVLSTPFHGYWKNLALAITNRFDDHWHPLRDFGHVKFFSRSTIYRLFQESGFEVQEWLAVGRNRLLARSMMVAALKPL